MNTERIGDLESLHHIYLLALIFVSRAIVAIQPSNIFIWATKHTPSLAHDHCLPNHNEIFIGARQTRRKLPFYARVSVERIELIASILQRDQFHVFCCIVCYLH